MRIISFFRLVQNKDLKLVQCHQMPPVKRRFIELPNDYTDILNKASAYECPNGANISGKSKSVAMCLVCGDLLCFEVQLLSLFYTYFRKKYFQEKN